MSGDVREQLKEVGDIHRASRVPVEVHELRRVVVAETATPSSWWGRSSASSQGTASLGGPTVAISVAAMIMVVIGGLAFLLAGPPAQQMDVVDSVNEIPAIGPAVVVDGHEPFGPVSIEYSVEDFGFLPDGNVFQHDWGMPHGGMVRSDTGFLALASSDPGPMTVVHSTEESTGWEEVETNLEFGVGDRGRLFGAGGWYWIETRVPTALYRSRDGANWEEIEVDCDRSCIPVGFPFIDHRFVLVGDELIAFGEKVVSVSTASGEVSSSLAPWNMPDTFWLSTSVVGAELQVILSPFPEDADRPEAPEEWVYAGSGDWTGPEVPTVDVGEKLLGIVGQPWTGYVAGSWDGSHNSDRADGFFSADGRAWERFELPLGYEVLDPVAPIKINGKQALVSFRDTTAGRHALWLSDDGVTWQLITLEVPDGERVSVAGRVTVSALDDTIYVYQQNLSRLSVWKVTFND